MSGSSPIAKEVHILTNTNISKDNVVISSSKFEKIRYSISNSMDLTCLPESENTSSVLDTFQEIDARTHVLASELECNLKIHYGDTSSSSDCSGPVGKELTGNQTGKYSRLSINGHKTQDGKYTQHFTSQNMDLTCMKSYFQDDSLCGGPLTNNDGGVREHPDPPYFQLQQVPLVDSSNQEIMSRNMNQSVGMERKMFKLCTDNFSFPKDSSKVPETRKRSLSSDTSKNNYSGLLPNALEDTSVKVQAVHTELDSDSGLRVGISNVPRRFDVDKHCVKSLQDKPVTAMSVVKRQLQPQTPGVVYNIRRIRQSLKEESNHIILFPELSQVMKKQKCNFKHPYSDMKITSPVCNPGKLSRSFDACSRETSFTCQPRESSVRPSIEPLPKTDLSPRKSSVTCQPRKSSVCPSIEPLPSVLPNTDLSPSKSLLDPSVAFQGSLCVSKADTIPSSEQPSGMDDSLQLLPYSALESSYLDAASKNFTICLDRSDFVVKVPGSNTLPEECSLTAQGNVNASVQNEIGISQIAGDSLLQDNIDLVCASQGKSEEIVPTDAVDNETPLANDVPSIPPEINKSTKITSIEDFDAGIAITLTVPSSQSSEQKAPINKSFAEKSPASRSFADRIMENDSSFPFPSLRSDALQCTPSRKQGLNTPSKIPRLRNKECVNIHISQESKSPTKKDSLHPVACKMSTSSKAVAPSDIQDDINETIRQEAVIQGEVPFMQNLVHNMNIPVDTLYEEQKPIVTIPPKDLPKKLADADLAQQTSIKEAIQESKEPLKMQAKKSENSESINGGKSRVPSGSMFSLDLNSWKEKFEKASSGETTEWKMKSLLEDCAVFEVYWKVFVLECVVQVEVKSIGASQTSVSFVPVGTNLRNKVVQQSVDDIQDRAYSYFKYLVTDTVFPFTICSEDLIHKLAEYSKIAKDVETLMRDLLKLDAAGTNTVSYELDPLTVYFRVINTNYKCVLDMTFPIDLKKYPRGRIVPVLKQVYCKDITKEVAVAVSCVEPGKDYLYRMVKAARDVKP